jgi:hypothetical protein
MLLFNFDHIWIFLTDFTKSLKISNDTKIHAMKAPPPSHTHKWILKKQDGRAWAGLIWLRDKDRWQAHVNAVNTVMKLHVPSNVGNE